MIVPLDHTICEVSFTKQNLCVEFADGRQLCAPLEWFPLLHSATIDRRDEFEISADGMTVSWPEIGERISADFLLARRQSVARQAG
jgi:hypothetical protein